MAHDENEILQSLIRITTMNQGLRDACAARHVRAGKCAPALDMRGGTPVSRSWSRRYGAIPVATLLFRHRRPAAAALDTARQMELVHMLWTQAPCLLRKPRGARRH